MTHPTASSMASVFGYLRTSFRQANHPLWVVLQQVGVRGLQAVKFLLAARLLGPEQVGLVGIALICLAVAEGMSDTGLAQAVVQNRRSVNRWQAGAVWTLQITRGAGIAVCLWLLASPIAWAFDAPASASLVALAGGVALLRNSLNPGLYLAQRQRNFRKLSVYEVTAAFVDIATTLLLIRAGLGADSMLLGSLAGEASKSAMTWTWFRFGIQPSMHWRLIARFTSFGKWIWGSSIITLLLNQFDKILVAKLLGTTEFGLYQVASRFAQLTVSDGSMALGQYLYPNFSHRYRESANSARAYFYHIAKRVIPVLTAIVTTLFIFAPLLLETLLGSQWTAAGSTLRILAIASGAGAAIALMVPYLRATAKPHIVTKAASIQLAIFAPLAIILGNLYNATGVALATTLGGIATAMFLLFNIRGKNE